MDESVDPKPTGRTSPVAHAGYLLPWRHEQPVYTEIRSASENVLYVPIFSTEERLLAFMRDLGDDTPYSVKQVTDTREFASSFPDKLPDGTKMRVVVDLRRENGKTKFLMLMKD